MNILTKNRILQEGDEVYASGEWMKVPSTEFGLQIEFSKYGNMQIRRPSEAPISPSGDNPAPAVAPIVPEPVTATAEAEQVPASGFSPAGRESPKPKPLSETYGKAKPKVLPTVVSKKAHNLTPAKPAPLPSTGFPPDIRIPYSDLSALPNWIGRNGTFKATAMRLTAMPNGLIQIRPEGARGLAKNALIEFPAADIPKIIDWLLRQLPAPTPK